MVKRKLNRYSFSASFVDVSFGNNVKVRKPTKLDNSILDSYFIFI